MIKKDLNSWIPVDEKLPDAGGEFLVTINGRYAKNTLVKCCSFSEGKFEMDGVIAWMNLPLPYRF